MKLNEEDCIKDILQMSYAAQCGHIPSALSMITYLSVILGDDKICPQKYRFVLGKPFGSQAYYSIFSRLGWIDADISKFGSTIDNKWRYIIQKDNPVVSYIDESMGNCLSIANGFALANKEVYINISDAAFQEGSIWEAALFAGTHHLNRIFMTVDYNGLQALGKTKDINDLGHLEDKLTNFGWKVFMCDGHNKRKIFSVYKKACNYRTNKNKPTAILFKTQKGHGVKFMENNSSWHYKTLNAQLLNEALEGIKV